MIDETKFHKNERPNEYQACFKVEGEVRVTINADSLEEAEAKAAAMTDDEDFGTELDDVEWVDVRHVRKTPPMFLVTRDGQNFQVSRLSEGDEPREPTETGF